MGIIAADVVLLTACMAGIGDALNNRYSHPECSFSNGFAVLLSKLQVSWNENVVEKLGEFSLTFEKCCPEM